MTHFFPSGLESVRVNKGMAFHIYEFSKQNSKRGEKGTVVSTIGLPLANNLTDSSSVDYEILDVLAMETLLNKDLSVVDKIKQGAEVAGRKMLSDAVASVGRPEVTNPRLTNRFKGVPFKSFSYEFTLIAKNQEESEAIYKIVNLFKYYMAPGVRSQTSFTHPNIVEIEFFPKPLREKMYKPNRCAILGVNVTYNGSAQPAFFRETQAPVEVVLGLDLQELEIETKESINSKYGVRDS